MNVIRFPALHPAARAETDERARNLTFAHFAALRSSMFHAFSAWMANDPSPEDVAMEVDGTVSGITQLKEMMDR